MKNNIFACSGFSTPALLSILGRSLPLPKFAVGQSVFYEDFCTDELDPEHFMQTFYQEGVITGMHWDDRLECWRYFLYFERSTWQCKAGFHYDSFLESELRSIR